jgi:hypothetical protein
MGGGDGFSGIHVRPDAVGTGYACSFTVQVDSYKFNYHSYLPELSQNGNIDFFLKFAL